MKMLLGWSMLAMLLPAMGGVLPEQHEITVVDDRKLPLLAFHELQVNTFLGSGGQGFTRMYSEVSGVHGTLSPFQEPKWQSDDMETSISVFDLVGIVASPSPRVYLVNSKLPVRRSVFNNYVEMELPFPAAVMVALPRGDQTIEVREGEEVVVRPADAFEIDAIERLKAGHALALKKDGTLTRAVGAVRASASCLRCHDNSKVGDLLGAFTYFIHDTPADHKAGRARLARLIATQAKPSVLWEALGTEPIEPSIVYVPSSSEVQLAVELARRGIITDALLSIIEQQRTSLEQKHHDMKEPVRRWKKPSPGREKLAEK